MPPLTYDSVLDGSAMIEIGSSVSLRLIGDRRCYIKCMPSGDVVLTPPEDIVDLQQVPEDIALKICVLLDYTDEDMVDLLRRRTEAEPADTAADADSDGP